MLCAPASPDAGARLFSAGIILDDHVPRGWEGRVILNWLNNILVSLNKI